jgi:hypothetical protein
MDRASVFVAVLFHASLEALTDAVPGLFALRG